MSKHIGTKRERNDDEQKKAQKQNATVDRNETAKRRGKVNEEEGEERKNKPKKYRNDNIMRMNLNANKNRANRCDEKR